LELARNYSVFEIPNDLTMLHQRGGHYSVNSMRRWFRTVDWNYEKWRWYISRSPQFVREVILHWPTPEPRTCHILVRTITGLLCTAVCVRVRVLFSVRLGNVTTTPQIYREIIYISTQVSFHTRWRRVIIFTLLPL